MRVSYRNNNSGGTWWLTDRDWQALELAGWMVEWGRLYFCSGRFGNGRPEGATDCGKGSDCEGHRRYQSFDEVVSAGDDARWLGALATSASKEFNSPTEAMREFEKITHQNVMDEGCNCCGAPHEFSWDGGYASGEDCAPHMFGEGAPRTLRDALESKA